MLSVLKLSYDELFELFDNFPEESKNIVDKIINSLSIKDFEKIRKLKETKKDLEFFYETSVGTEKKSF